MEEMISRDAVLTILNHNWGKPKGYSQSMNEISELPTVQPRIGHWCMAEEAKKRLENGDMLLGWMPWFVRNVVGQSESIRQVIARHAAHI